MKQSVIMQSYLGDYPGSRKDPEVKFIRAVGSFLGQSHQDKELIIVSDGCKITEKLYYDNFKSFNNIIKYEYLNKDGSNMFESADGQKIFKGTAKKIGCEIASGDIISYLDSDDVIMSNRLSDINSAWENYGLNAEYGGCISRLLPINELESYLKLKNKESLSVKIFDLTDYGINSFFFSKEPSNGMFFTMTCHHTHRKDIPILWEDSVNKFEDAHFFNRILYYYRNNSDKIFSFNSQTYIVCHDNGGWDY